MEFDSILLGIILIAGLVVACFGVNIYRYAVIFMSAAGGYMLANIVYGSFFSEVEGEGVFRSMEAGAGRSFIMAFFIIVGAALGFFLFKIMGPVVAAVGGGFMFSKMMQVLMGADVTSAIIGWVMGIFIGALLGGLAVMYQRWFMIIFTALVGARMAAYTGAFFLAETTIAPSIAKPVLGLFPTISTFNVIAMALSLELFIVITVIGLVAQAILRND
ncbi:MAG: hypothetical protein IJ757_07600 [Clostridiales bacterium]|nr:hypothetical protein [Clostridiales bacterium]